MHRYLWVCTLFLVTVAAMLTAGITKAYLVNRITAPLSIAPIQAEKPAELLTTKLSLQHYESITKRNIFNANPPAPSPLPVPDVPPRPTPDPRQPLQLKLVGVVTGGAAPSLAVLEDKRNAGTQTVYQIGDIVQEARIIEIRPECVILERQGQSDKICFETEGVPSGAGARQSSAPGRAPARGEPPTPQLAARDDILRVDSATWQVRRDLVLEQFANFGSLAEQANAIPYSSQGQPQGFRLTKLKAGSLLQQIGLQNGDVLRKVNDLELRSPQEALQAYQQLQNARTVRLEILRRNQPTTFTYELR